MRPLHMPEIFIVERFRQGYPVILEGMDRAVLAVEKRARVGNLGEGVADQPAGADRRGNRVFRKIDRAFLVLIMSASKAMGTVPGPSVFSRFRRLAGLALRPPPSFPLVFAIRETPISSPIVGRDADVVLAAMQAARSQAR
jgi:hypothetical protein